MLYKMAQTYCPVCQSMLGWRQKDSLADFYCEECRATFYWHPGDKDPSNDKGTHKPVHCGCGICGR